MRLKPSLLCAAAAGAILALAATEGAQARTHKVHRAAGPSRSELELRSEVESLKAEVNSLENRLNNQSQSQQQVQAQTQAQIQAAQAQAQAAQTSAQAAQTQVAAQQSQIQTIPDQVATATKAAAPKPGWWNNTTVGGTIFADLSYIRNENDGVSNSQSGVNYDIKRAYITIDHRFNDVFAANITTDFTYDSTTKATQLYIKKAYLQAHLNDAFIVRAGGADMPWVPYVESLYGYRYVDKVLVDNYGYGTSADWGVHVLGKLFDDHLGYAFSVVDGAGYKAPSMGTVFTGPAGISGRPNTMDFEGRVNANFSHFNVAVGGYVGKLGQQFDGPTSPPTYHTAERFDALAAYSDARFRLGVEYMYAHFYKDVLQADPTKTNSAEAISAFGSWSFTPQWSIFGRYDWIKPQRDTNNSFDSNFFDVGVGYKPIGPLDIALVYKRDSVTNGLLSTGNGSIGTLSSPPVGKGTYDEVGLFTQLKF